MDSKDDCDRKTRGHGYFIPVGGGGGGQSVVAPTRCDLVDGLYLYKTGQGTNQNWSVYREGDSYPKYNIKDLNGIFGGKEPNRDCGEIYRKNDVAVVKVGWKQDLLLAFGAIKEDGKTKAMSVMSFFPHEQQLHISMTDDGFVGQYGRKNDLYIRACFKPGDDVRWWHNHWHRDGPGPCTDKNWPAFYNTSGIEQVELNKAP